MWNSRSNIREHYTLKDYADAILNGLTGPVKLSVDGKKSEKIAASYNE